MKAMAFDTLKLAQRLEEAGFAPRQAAATSSAIAEAMAELLASLATKHDLAREIGELRAETRHEFALMRRDMSALELRMTVKLGAMMAAAVGITGAFVRLL